MPLLYRFLALTAGIGVKPPCSATGCPWRMMVLGVAFGRRQPKLAQLRCIGYVWFMPKSAKPNRWHTKILASDSSACSSPVIGENLYCKRVGWAGLANFLVEIQTAA
jgi:hypothetical protein